MKRLIVNADDFGMALKVNEGIGYAHEHGILTSTTVMMNKPYALEMKEYQRRFPNLGFGIHLVLTSGKPLGKGYKTLTDERGVFKRSFITDDDFDVDEAYEEFMMQVRLFQETNGNPTHIDSHHHVHQKPKLKPVIERIASELNIPVRRQSGYMSDILRMPVRCDSSFYGQSVGYATLEAIIKRVTNQEVVECMTHVGFVDKEVIEASIYNFKRVEELVLITSEEVKKLIENEGITLVNYRGL
jgi:predicted glycoside hydrolase/deacetylase ChbG (UPF0249 family)